MLISRTNQNRKFKKNISDSIDLIPMINLIFLLLIFFMLTGVIKKKEILDIERAESSHGIESKILKDEVLLSLNQDGKIYLNNIPTELVDLERSIDSKSSKLVIDVDKRVKILKFNELLDKIKELDQKKVFIKVVELNDGI
jgi:biopolymer transport protein ExbD